jgi:hypothetical protein
VSSLRGLKYKIEFNLYSEDGKREVEVRLFENRQAYIVERDQIDDGTYKARHSGSMVGPFESPEAAERFIVQTAWFTGAAE